MAKSLRKIAADAGIDHSTLSKIRSGKYPANPKRIFSKILDVIDAVVIPPDKYDEILYMLDSAKFSTKLTEAHRTAAWLYQQILQAKRHGEEKL